MPDINQDLQCSFMGNHPPHEWTYELPRFGKTDLITVECYCTGVETKYD